VTEQYPQPGVEGARFRKRYPHILNGRNLDHFCGSSPAL
jgi:hypothetical protein